MRTTSFILILILVLTATMAAGEPDRSRTHILTVAVEDYFHGSALNPLVPTRDWRRLESTVERDLKFARAWLRRRLEHFSAGHG